MMCQKRRPDMIIFQYVPMFFRYEEQLQTPNAHIYSFLINRAAFLLKTLD